jgi:MFS family permease
MGFMAMYLHYCGHSDASAAMIVSAMLLGRALGGVLGGFLGDMLASRSPNHGRPLTAEASVFLGIPFTVALVHAAPGFEFLLRGWLRKS